MEEYLQMIQKADEEIEARKMDLELERKDAAAIAKDPEIIEIEEVGALPLLTWPAC